MWLFCAAETLYLAMWNVLLFARPKFIILRILTLFIQMFAMAFSSAFVDNYLTSVDNSGPTILSYVGMYSPTVQLFMGIFVVQYRYPHYNNNVLKQEEIVVRSDSFTVNPYGEYGATLQVKILLIQIAVYGFLLLLFLCRCKTDLPPESGDIEPE